MSVVFFKSKQNRSHKPRFLSSIHCMVEEKEKDTRIHSRMNYVGKYLISKVYLKLIVWNFYIRCSFFSIVLMNNTPVRSRHGMYCALQWHHAKRSGISVVCSNASSSIDHWKYQSSTLLAFARGILWWSMDSSHKGPVTWKMLPFDEVIMTC